MVASPRAELRAAKAACQPGMPRDGLAHAMTASQSGGAHERLLHWLYIPALLLAAAAAPLVKGLPAIGLTLLGRFVAAGSDAERGSRAKASMVARSTAARRRAVRTIRHAFVSQGFVSPATSVARAEPQGDKPPEIARPTVTVSADTVLLRHLEKIRKVHCTWCTFMTVSPWCTMWFA